MTTFEASLINAINNMQINSYVPWLNISLLIITAVLVFWYAHEARRQAEATILNNDIQTLPFFTVKFMDDNSIESSENKSRPYLVNIAKGIATNVIIGLQNQPAGIPKDVNLKLETIPSFAPGHTKKLTNQFFWGDAIIPNINLAWGDFTRKENPIRLEIIVQFENIFGHKYSQTIKVDKNGIAPQKIIKL